jgi:hypothetical protein
MSASAESRRPFAWALAILATVAIAFVALAPRRNPEEQRGNERVPPPQLCHAHDCERLVPPLDFAIELYVQRTGGLY